MSTTMSTEPAPASRSSVTLPVVWSNLPRHVEMPMWSASKLGYVCVGSTS